MLILISQRHIINKHTVIVTLINNLNNLLRPKICKITKLGNFYYTYTYSLVTIFRTTINNLSHQGISGLRKRHAVIGDIHEALIVSFFSQGEINLLIIVPSGIQTAHETDDLSTKPPRPDNSKDLLSKVKQNRNV